MPPKTKGLNYHAEKNRQAYLYQPSRESGESNYENLQTSYEVEYAGETTSKSRFDGLTAGTTAYRIGRINDSVHFHDAPTICFLLRGGSVEKRSRLAYERTAADVRFYHASEVHQSIIKVFPSKCVNLEFEDSFLNRYETSDTAINRAVMKNVDVRLLMLKIYGELLIGDVYTDSSVRMLMLSMLDETKPKTRRTPSWVAHLSEMLNDRWAEQLSLEDLAQAAQVHPTTVSKHFTRYFACTFGEYMRKLKINKSIHLIKTAGCR